LRSARLKISTIPLAVASQRLQTEADADAECAGEHGDRAEAEPDGLESGEHADHRQRINDRGVDRVRHALVDRKRGVDPVLEVVADQACREDERGDDHCAFHDRQNGQRPFAYRRDGRCQEPRERRVGTGHVEGQEHDDDNADVVEEPGRGVKQALRALARCALVENPQAKRDAEGMVDEDRRQEERDQCPRSYPHEVGETDVPGQSEQRGHQRHAERQEVETV
jgi:hypothetical protein